jgi:hypothetical protein
MSRYTYQLTPPNGVTAQNIVWSVVNDVSNASTISGLNGQSKVKLDYAKDIASMVKLKATFDAVTSTETQPGEATWDIALVKVSLANPSFQGFRTTVDATNPLSSARFQVSSANPTYDTTYTPGSDVTQFKMTSGTVLPSENAKIGLSGDQYAIAYDAHVDATLTAPSARTEAITKITAGFIQALSSNTGLAQYNFGGGTIGTRT